MWWNRRNQNNARNRYQASMQVLGGMISENNRFSPKDVCHYRSEFYVCMNCQIYCGELYWNIAVRNCRCICKVHVILMTVMSCLHCLILSRKFPLVQWNTVVQQEYISVYNQNSLASQITLHNKRSSITRHQNCKHIPCVNHKFRSWGYAEEHHGHFEQESLTTEEDHQQVPKRSESRSSNKFATASWLQG